MKGAAENLKTKAESRYLNFQELKHIYSDSLLFGRFWDLLIISAGTPLEISARKILELGRLQIDNFFPVITS